MIFFYIAALFFSNSDALDMHKLLAKQTSQSHLICLSLLPINIAEKESWSSLICGEKLTNKKLQQQLSQNSLIHIFVVSGAHLVLIQSFFSLLRIPTFFRLIALFVYSLATLFQPPCVRSLIALILHESLQKRDQKLSATMLCLWASLYSIVLVPEWMTSRSLLMSWVAALTVSQNYSKHSLANLILKCCFCYLLMIPLLWGFSSLHPIGILMNTILAPLIALLLFPLGLACLLFSFLGPLFDSLIAVLKLCMTPTQELISMPQSQTVGIVYLWAYTFCLQILFHLFQLIHHRSQT